MIIISNKLLSPPELKLSRIVFLSYKAADFFSICQSRLAQIPGHPAMYKASSMGLRLVAKTVESRNGDCQQFLQAVQAILKGKVLEEKRRGKRGEGQQRGGGGVCL